MTDVQHTFDVPNTVKKAQMKMGDNSLHVIHTAKKVLVVLRKIDSMNIFYQLCIFPVIFHQHLLSAFKYFN